MNNRKSHQSIPSSFRDPAGFLFEENGVLYRQINSCYQTHYQALMASGLYNSLVKKRYLIAHEEMDCSEYVSDAYKTIKPERVACISYPYEWSFSQLKDAALLTLNIQQLALEKGLSLKDASTYNIQFYNGKPILIDTLSFERYQENLPWVAYRQFCQHFLAPLALMAKVDVSLNQLFCTNIDGVPLQLASKLLPLTTYMNFGLAVHIHLHAKAQNKNADKAILDDIKQKTFSKKSFLALIEHLKSTIKGLHWQPKNTEWFDYYDSNNNYVNDALEQKDALVEQYLQIPAFIGTTWDLGANTGRFSHIAAKYSQQVCAWDIDAACVELHYQTIKKHKAKKVLPLLLNLTTPSAAIGWNNEERMSFVGRAPVDMVLALGLIHHLAISNNVPLHKIAQHLSQLANNIIIEFVPKEDSQVIKLLQNREDVFTDYTIESFELIFASYFSIDKKEAIQGTKRTLYFLTTLNSDIETPL